MLYEVITLWKGLISINPEKDEELWGAWRWYRETGNGYTADWGAHMFDIAQAAIGMA